MAQAARERNTVSPLLHKLSMVGAVVALAFPGSTQAQEHTSSLQELGAVAPLAASPHDLMAGKDKNLEEIKDLPGFSLQVTPRQRFIQRASEVKIFVRYSKTIYGAEGMSCSGNAIAYGGTVTVRSAAHCFDDFTRSKQGFLKSRQDGIKALDFFDSQAMDVAIMDQNYPVHATTRGVRRIVGYKSPQPMAYANGVAIGFNRDDEALLRLDDRKTAILTAHGNRPIRKIDQVIPLLYKPAIAPPSRGQEVALYGTSSYGDRDRTVSTIGRYVGRMVQEGREVDVIAVHAATEAQDPCYPETSGETPKLADGHILGALSRFFNIGYGKHNAITYPDPRYSKLVIKMWHKFEEALGVRLPASRYNDLCFSSVEHSSTLPNLISGFGMHADKKSKRP